MKHQGETTYRSGTFAAAFIGALTLFSSLSSAALIMEYESSLDIVTGQERAIRPTAVSCSPATGEICVTDAQYSAFHVLNGHGIEVFRTGGFSSLSTPIDGTLTSDGGFVFIDRDPGGFVTIRRLNFMGEPVEFDVEAPIERWDAAHLAVAQNGDLLTVDSFNGIVARHDSQTGALRWHTEVTADGATDLQLGRPMEAPDGRIYVPGGMQHSVTVFSAEGRRMEEFGEFGSGPGKFVFPVGVAIGPEQSILVLDRMRHKVLMFNSEHELLGEFGSMGAGLGQFYHPSAIAASDDGTVYVAQGYGGRIQAFNIRDTRAE
jgi:DNA-binding beta-propeller fold protein YncE